MNARQRERLRRQFRPERVRVLFVGESPPASGRFFYRGDSGLYRAMREAFQAAGEVEDDGAFLGFFQATGHYFVDLCVEPVDKLETAARRARCREGEEELARTIARLRPATIVTVVRSIEGNVMRAAARAKWKGTMMHVPYPGRWARYRRRFVDALGALLAPSFGRV